MIECMVVRDNSEVSVARCLRVNIGSRKVLVVAVMKLV